METLRRQVALARRRLVLQSFLGRLAWCWFATLLVAALAIGLAKIWPPLADVQGWAIGCLGAALAVGLVAAGAWTWTRRQSTLEAAVEIDRRFALKERVSSSLALAPDQLQSDAAQALVHDTAQRVDRLDVADGFPLGLDRRALLPVAPAVAACLLAIFVQPTANEQHKQAAAQSEQIKKSTQALAKKIDQERKQAEEQGLTEADALLKQLQENTKSLANKNAVDKKQTLVALNELVKDAVKRREQLAGSAEMKQQLNQLKNLQKGPADKIADAMKKGDLQQAIKEVDKLKEQLDGDKLNEADKQALARQMEQMQQSLEKMVDAHKQAQEDLKQEVEKQRRAGNTAEAAKLQQQLDKLAQKNPQMDKLAQMADQLKKASQCMNQGDCKQAGDALAKLSNDLAGMQQEMAELETLDSALDDIAEAKRALACQECDGEGCKACQGQGKKFGDKWQRSKFAKGGGIGAGERDEKETDTGFYDSKVKQNIGRGASVVTGTADGPNRKGRVQEEIKGSFTGAEQQTAEALSDQRLPHDYRDHAKKYFDALREGQK